MSVRKITYVVEVNTANGKVKIDGLTKGFVNAENAAKKFNATLQTTGKNAGQAASKTGLAGAAVVEIGRTISDANFGMMAMANNLQQLSTLMVTLIATSGGLANGIKALWTAFMGPLGLIVVFQTFIMYLERADKNQKQVESSANKMAEAYKNAATELELLLELDNTLTDEQRKNIEERIRLLRAEATVRAQIAEIQRLQTKILREERREMTDFVPWYQAIWSAVKTGSFDLQGFNPNQSFVAEMLGIGGENKQKTIDELEKQIADIIAAIDPEALRREALGDGDGEDRMQSAVRIKKIFGIDEETFQRPMEIATAQMEELLNYEGYVEAERTRVSMYYAQRRADFEELMFQNRMTMLTAYGDAAQAVGFIIGEQTEAGKMVAAAGALINTYAAIAGQLKAFAGIPIPGYAIAQAIATGAVGFAQVAQIYRVNTSGRNSGSASEQQATTPTATPNFNIVGSSGVSQLQETVEGALNRPVQAYVTTKQIRSGEELDRNTRQGASIG